MLVLQPGNWSAQRHWHQNEDEFVYILEGEVVLVTDEGETVLQAGRLLGFPPERQMATISSIRVTRLSVC